MIFQELVNHLYDCYPYSFECDWDNCGPQVGDYGKTISRILISLDITDDVVSEAVECGADCILSHHPLIFRPLKRVCSSGAGELAFRLISNNICAVSMHTNFDAAPGGVGDRLALALGLEEISEFCSDEDEIPMGRVGDITACSPEEFIKRIKKALGAKSLRAVICNDICARVACVGGGGRSFIENAAKIGADTFVTSDCRYHDFQRAKELGITLIDAGHFETENIALEEFRDNINENFPDVEVIMSRHKNIIETF